MYHSGTRFKFLLSGLLTMSVLLLVACQSTPMKIKTSQPKALTPIASTTKKNKQSLEFTKPAELAEIDYSSIQRLLSLDKSRNELGYEERAFNTCQVGFGFSPLENCQNKYFVVIHFKLMCRDSEGTISYQLSEADLKPVSNEKLRWTLKNLNGVLETDSMGFGEIVAIATQSPRHERLRLSSAKDFLLIRAYEINRLIVPSNWCN